MLRVHLLHIFRARHRSGNRVSLVAHLLLKKRNRHRFPSTPSPINRFSIFSRLAKSSVKDVPWPWMLSRLSRLWWEMESYSISDVSYRKSASALNRPQDMLWNTYNSVDITTVAFGQSDFSTSTLGGSFCRIQEIQVDDLFSINRRHFLFRRFQQCRSFFTNNRRWPQK